jgi:hypothetical protein
MDQHQRGTCVHRFPDCAERSRSEHDRDRSYARVRKVASAATIVQSCAASIAIQSLCSGGLIHKLLHATLFSRHAVVTRRVR